MVPVEAARKGKQVVLRAWICRITNESIYPGLVEGEPGGVQVRYYRCSVDEVAKKKHVIVVIRITEVLAGITCDITP